MAYEARRREIQREAKIELLSDDPCEVSAASFLIDGAQKKHLISSVAAICAAYSAEKVHYLDLIP